MSEQQTRIISANDTGVMMTQFLNAAEKIHLSMCLFDDDHAAQSHLASAMQSVLIGAQQCTTLYASKKHSIAQPGAAHE